MPQHNISAPFSNSTTAIPAALAASVSGVATGTQHAAVAGTDAGRLLNSDHANTLLAVLDVIYKGAGDKHDELAPGLDLSPAALHDMLKVTHVGIATIVEKILLAVPMVLTNGSQLVTDMKIFVEALVYSIVDSHELLQTERASTLDVNQELADKRSGFSANCQALHQHFRGIIEAMSHNVDGAFPKDGSAAISHANFVKSTGFTAAAGSLGTAGLVSFLIDAIGAHFRESTGLVEFSNRESFHPQEHNLYKALSVCSYSISKSQGSDESLAALRELEEAISNYKQASELAHHHSLSAPSVSVFTRMLTADPFVKSLMAVNSSGLALTASHKVQQQEKENFSRHTRDSAGRASRINGFSEGNALNHCQNVTDFNNLFDVALGHLDDALKDIPDHSSIASSAATTVRANSALIIASSLITGLTGMISREFSGSIDFTKNDEGTGPESRQVMQSRQDMTGADLDAVMSRICALRERLDRCKELGISAPVVLGISEAITFGALSGSLNVLAGFYSALLELRTLGKSPSVPLQLDAAEELEAQRLVDSVIESHKKTAGTVATGPISENLTMHNHLLSVMRKLVLSQRSYKNPIERLVGRDDLASAGKSTIGFVEGNVTGSLASAIALVFLSGLETGVSIEATSKGLRFSTQQKKVSGGPDKIVTGKNYSVSNFSFLSNATRLTQDALHQSTLLQTVSSTTNLASESLASRSLIVAMCHSGALKDMLKRLIAAEQEKLVHAPGHLDSIVVSDRTGPRLAGEILAILDAADAGHNPIPGLNKDMASTIGAVSNTVIAGAIATHSTLIAPFLKSAVASKAASVIADEQKNEGLSHDSVMSKEISICMNTMQAFIINSIAETQKIEDPIKHSTVANTVDKASEVSAFALCGLSLMLDEMFETTFSRYTALLDHEKVAKTNQQSKENTQKDSDNSRNAIADDTGRGDDSNSTQATLALRLTLSRLGNSLMEFASRLEKHPDLLEANLKMHTAQRSMVNSMASLINSCGSSMLGLSGLLSQFPLSTAGVVDCLREVLHSSDGVLVLRPSHSCMDSTIKDRCSESSLLTGMTTDSVVSLLVTVVKVLLQGSIIGLDASLSITKLLEVLCIHPHPGQALELESKGMSLPNGSSKNTNRDMHSTAVIATLVPAAVSIGTRTGDSDTTNKSIACKQGVIVKEIDKIQLLQDDEEKGDVLGLQGFYIVLIKILAEGAGDALDYQDIARRFNMGGIALANYHAVNGGIVDDPKYKPHTNRLIVHNLFKGSDKPEDLIRLFIEKAAHEETFKPKLGRDTDRLLNKLKAELVSQPHLSKKVIDMWKQIVDKVIDELWLINERRGLAYPGDARLSKKDVMDRKAELINLEDVAPNPAYTPV